MLRVRSRVLAVVGLLVLAVLAVQLVQGALTVPEAALRVLVAMVVLALVDRVALPVARDLVGAPRPEPPAEGSPEQPSR